MGLEWRTQKEKKKLKAARSNERPDDENSLELFDENCSAVQRAFGHIEKLIMTKNVH